VAETPEIASTPPLWSLAVILPMVLLFSAIASLGWHSAAAALGLSRALTSKAAFTLIETLGILLPALGLGQIFKADPEATFPMKRVGAQAVLAAIAATLGLSTLLTYLQDVYQKAFGFPYPESLIEILTIHTPLDAVLLVAGVVLAAALCEEVLFRGYCQSALQARFGPWVAILLTALLFAAFHLEPAGLPTYLLLGAWLGWLRHAGGSLRLPILAHATNNLLALVQVNILGEAFWTANMLLILPGGLLLASVGAFHLHRMPR